MNSGPSQAELRERWLNGPTYTASAWAALRTETNGKAPLVAPPRRAMESRRAEFAYFLGVVRANPTQTPWENLRLAEMCLLFQGEGAEPSRAFDFFSKSNPSWPEVQLGLGLCHLRGYGVTPDPAKARTHLEAAAVEAPAAKTRYTGGGEAFRDITYLARRELAVAYDLGQGLPADAALALQWYGSAENRTLMTRDYNEIRALRVEFWKRQSGRARALAEQEFVRARGGDAAPRSTSLFQDLVASGDAQALHDLGEFVDIRDVRGQEIARGRVGLPYFLAAAKLGHEPAARAFFSPAKNGSNTRDLDGDPAWREHGDFVREQWPAWEKKWLAAAQAGDASAHVPLAFHYSGARGNPPNLELAQRHAAALPATTPPAQRAAITGAIALHHAREGEAWVKTLWAKLGATAQTIDLNRLKTPADPERGAALREEGITLASTDLKQARDRWRDAAAIGDLPAQVHLHLYAKRNRIHLGDYYKSLQARLEAAANAGDPGAMAVLSVVLDGSYNSTLSFPTAIYALGQEWRGKAITHAPRRAQWLEVAKNTALSDAHCAEVRAAVLVENEAWHARARTWGLTGQQVMAELTVSEEELRTVDGMRAQFVALAGTARQVAEQLALWETTVDARDFDPEADARYLQGHQAWRGADEDERDLAQAVDYFSQSAGLGQPMAPLVFAYFFGSGHGGFPKDADLSRRFRRLCDARLSALAETGDTWAQTILGDMLVAKPDDDTDNALNPGLFEWLPRDWARGMKWLEAAAIEGAVLPRNFGDSSGQTVAFYVSNRHYDAEDKVAHARWKLIDELYRRIDPTDEKNAKEWADALMQARGVLAESAATTLARMKLDQAVEDAEGDGGFVAARRQRALSHHAAGLHAHAFSDADIATSIAPTDASLWRLLAQIQQSRGEAADVAVCLSLAQALEKEAAAPARFEASFAKLDQERQGDIRDRLEEAVKAHPDIAVMKDLHARAAKFEKRP